MSGSRQPFAINYQNGMILVDPKTGRATKAMDRIMVALVQRTGGSAGPVVSASSGQMTMPASDQP